MHIPAGRSGTFAKKAKKNLFSLQKPQGLEFAVEARDVSNDRRHDPLTDSRRRCWLCAGDAQFAPLRSPLPHMNGGPFSTDPVVQEDYISPLPDAASWPCTQPVVRSTAPARGDQRWTLLCYYAMSATKYHCPRWQSSGRFHHLQKSRVQFSVDGKMCSEASPVSTSFPY